MPYNEQDIKKKWKLESVIALISVVFFLLILISSFLSMWAHFVPDESFTLSIKNISYIFSILLIISFGFVFYKQGTTISELAKRIGLKKFFFPLALLFMFWLLTFMFQDGVPIALHQFKNTQGEKVFTISNKQRYYRGRKGRCYGGVFIRHPSISTIKVCGLNRTDWNSAKEGDLIKVYGKVSNYGISYDSYSLIKD